LISSIEKFFLGTLFAMEDGADIYKVAAKYLLDQVKVLPQVGVVCGSGLSGLSKGMTDTQVVTYDEIPGFPKLHVAGHVGELVFGLLAGVPTVCMRGRFHFYEGHPMEKVVLGVRTMRCLGVKVVIVTNAAGGLNPDWNIGDVMCITDHFALPCLAGNHPLMGPNHDDLGPRFLPISNAYTQDMQDIVVKAAETLSFDFVRPRGCYGVVSGPTYEAPTEARWLRSMGVDSVGMSTVPEIIAAHHCGMKVIGLSLITNKVRLPGDTGPAANHAEVLEVAAQRADQMQALVKEIVSDLKTLFAQNRFDLPAIDLSGVKVGKAQRQGKAMKTSPKAMKRVTAAKKKTKHRRVQPKKPTKKKTKAR
jgi:purine-nucleoside phosphorylase